MCSAFAVHRALCAAPCSSPPMQFSKSTSHLGAPPFWHATCFALRMVLLRTLLLHLIIILATAFRVQAQQAPSVPEPPSPYVAQAYFNNALPAQQRRVQSSVPGELLGWVIGTTLGAAVTYGIAAGMSSADSGAETLIGMGVLNLLLLSSSGVYLGGKVAGGHGQYGYTMLGNLVGVLPGLLVFAVGMQDLSGDGQLLLSGFALSFIGSAVGSILGYETSSASTPPPPSRSRFSIAPMFTPRVARGFVAGVHGAF